MRSTFTCLQGSGRVIHYKVGSHQLVPKKYTVGRKIAVRTYLDMNRTDMSDRSYKPQKHWFEVPQAPHFTRPYEKRGFEFYNLETKMIWKAFDTPELMGILLRDEMLKGHGQVYDDHFLEAALHWTREARYWRCIGISKPFFDENTLRAYACEKSADDGTLQEGTVVFSMAMRHALMDLERAVRRQEMGLDPNYLWDKWGPVGFIDGARSDFLPRFEHNPYVDPDGVDVTEVDVMPFSTHAQIRDRYHAFIEADPSPFEGVFLSPSHGHLTLEDLQHEDLVSMYRELQAAGGHEVTNASPSEIAPRDMRTLLYIAACPGTVERVEASGARTWQDVQESLSDLQKANDEKVDAARLLFNTSDDVSRVRTFFEEKCGFHDFMYTSDKTITAATIAYLEDLRHLCKDTDYGKALACAATDHQREAILGPEAFAIYRYIEDLLIDKRRRQWATRFAGDANEETTLDYMLENFGRRTERQKNVGSPGAEFDREQEPIGRNVQRRVLDSDKSHKLADMRKSRGKMWQRRKDLFDELHAKQYQRSNYIR